MRAQCSAESPQDVLGRGARPQETPRVTGCGVDTHTAGKPMRPPRPPKSTRTEQAGKLRHAGARLVRGPGSVQFPDS